MKVMQEAVQLQQLIYTIRGYRVMLDSDLAMLYEVETKSLNRAVKRNIERFPDNFMFQLTKEEWQNLRCQNGTFKHDVRKYYPYAFTEQGVAMLSSVLRSKKAIQVNIQIMNTFVRLRQWAIENKNLQEQISELRHYFVQYAKENNYEIDKINQAIDLLMDRTKPVKIGFRQD